jgi:hypothetical protein
MWPKNKTPQFLIHSHPKSKTSSVPQSMDGIETIQTIPQHCQVSALQAENRRLDALLQDALETAGIKPFGVPNRICIYTESHHRLVGVWVFLVFFIS